MRLLTVKAGICTLVAYAALAIAEPASAAANNGAVAAKKDVAIALAEYQRYYGGSDAGAEAALLALEEASVSYPVADNSDRLVYKAELFVELNRFAEAKQLFGQLLVKTKALQLMQKVAFPLAELNFANGDCEKSKRLLNVKKDKNVNQYQQGFFIEATCLVSSSSADVQALADLDNKIQQFVAEVKPSEIQIWLVYSYYNLASASLNAGMATEAEVYFERVFEYINQVAVNAEKADPVNQELLAELNALQEQTILTIAQARYQSNQYALAMESYAQLSLDGYWSDQGLLGYGWAAFNNFQRGVALESWRQLVYLPNKSMSVYEGLLAIPFALEKANAYARALTAYDDAISEFESAQQQIVELKQTLTLDQIKQHALEYVNSHGRAVEPLHPLLGATYTKPKFRTAIERLGEVAAAQKQLEQQKKELNTLAEIAAWQRGTANGGMQSEQDALKQRLRIFFKKIIGLRELLLLDAVANNRVDRAFKEKYNRYRSLKRVSVNNSGAGSERLDKLQGVLFWQMLEQVDYSDEKLASVSSLIATHARLQKRLEGFDETLKVVDSKRPSLADINQMQSRIAALEGRNNQVAANIEQYLLNLTVAALDEYSAVLDNYQKQASVASARLREEFYQLGGRRL